MKTAYKLMRADMTTHKGFQWVQGEWRETSGEGDLCGPGWLHAYASPTIAALHNQIHAAIDLTTAQLWEMEVEGQFRDDDGLKCGYTRMRPFRQIPLVVPTVEQRVRYAIYCALSLYDAPEFVAWAKKWLSGEDRSESAAWAAWAAAEAAWAAWAAARAAEAAVINLELLAVAAMNGVMPGSLATILEGVEVAR